MVPIFDNLFFCLFVLWCCGVYYVDRLHSKYNLNYKGLKVVNSTGY